MPKPLAKTCDKMIFMDIECISINCILRKCHRAVGRIGRTLNLDVQAMFNDYENNYDEVLITDHAISIHFKVSYINVR